MIVLRYRDELKDIGG